QDNGWEIRKGGYFQDDTCPHLGASLDYEIVSGHDQDGIGCLEIKNVNHFSFSKAWTDNEPPLHILLQLQHQLAATGYKWGVIAALRGGNEPYIFTYKENPKTIQNIRMKVNQFWKSLDDKTPPPPDSANINSEILKQLYPMPVEDDIDLSGDNELPALCAEFLKLKEAKKSLAQTQDQLKYAILEKLKGHKKGIVNGFYVTLSITPEKPSRPALPGEIINGRAEIRSLRIKEVNS
ncbi:YqaJ viral recombinase family protein, partial [Commensalibacter sp. Nvir]|uniref:YqaJ viral recombinase family protein n=1 Tax=Commensalibacter sp. Nvir TaxID=3069817 RepID=UPI0030C8D21E